MGLTKGEMREWRSLKAKSKRHKIPIRRIKGTSNVIFKDGVCTQLGIKRATIIMDARIKIKKVGYEYVKKRSKLRRIGV